MSEKPREPRHHFSPRVVEISEKLKELDLDPYAVVNSQFLCDWLGISLQTAKKWRMEKTGPDYIKYGAKTVRYKVTEIKKWLDDMERPSKED